MTTRPDPVMERLTQNEERPLEALDRAIRVHWESVRELDEASAGSDDERLEAAMEAQAASHDTFISAVTKYEQAPEAEQLAGRFGACQEELDRMRTAAQALFWTQIYEHGVKAEGVSVHFLMRLSLLMNAAGVLPDSDPFVKEAHQVLQDVPQPEPSGPADFRRLGVGRRFDD